MKEFLNTLCGLLTKIILLVMLCTVGSCIWSMVGTSPVATYRVPDTDIPGIRIRSGAYMDSQWFKVYLVKPFFDKKVINQFNGLPYGLDKIEPPEISSEVIIAIPSKKSKYGIVWSDDGNRFAFISRGWLVAAYDLKTGEKIDYPIGNKDAVFRTHNIINTFLEFGQSQT